jgi:integrase
VLVGLARQQGCGVMSQADTRIAIGKARESGGQRAWRAALYTPAGRYTLYRVTFKEQTDDGWTWTARTAPTEAEARRIFTQVEKALDAMVATPVRSSVQRGRTGKALAEAYLADSRDQGKAVRTVEQRENRLRVHIEPVLGDLPVAQWRLAHSRKVIDGAKARGVKSVGRLADIRQDMAAMRKLAWREGWLPRDVDPLDGLALPRQQTLHGAGRGYVPPDLRPARRHVDAMAAAGDHLSQHGPQELRRIPVLGTQIRLAGYAGLRLGEQLGLRAIDVFLDRGVVSVNGSWTQPRLADAKAFRGPVKNGLVHEAPLPASLRAELLPRCALLLGLPADASIEQVTRVQTEERTRRGRLSGSLERWWELEAPSEEELWLFVDTDTGLPPRTELFNDRWHRVRRWLATHDKDNAWPKHIVYRNLRHHAAGFWHDELGREWADVAAWLGDKLATVLDHYVRSGVDALADVTAALEAY